MLNHDEEMLYSMGSKCTSFDIFRSISTNDNPLGEVTQGAVMPMNMSYGLCAGQAALTHCQATEDGS